MATKRPAPHVHPSRQEQVPEEPRRRKQKPNHTGKSFKKAHTVNEIKSQIRSLKRLLEHNDDIPANVRMEKERALQYAQHELTQTEQAKKRSDMIGRYHKVRFFDRQKATKRLKRAKKELNECVVGSAEQRAELERKVQDAEVDVQYAMNYPLDRPYLALFPSKRKKDASDDDEESTPEAVELERKGDPEMWQRVKQCMADGTLKALREGKLMEAAETEQDETASPGRVANTKRMRPHKVDGPKEQLAIEPTTKKRKHREPENDDDSDGGFFE